MKTKFALLLALASFLAVTAVGTAFAGADPLSESSAVDPTTTTAVPSLQAPACANGLDDDGDGFADEEDPDCETPEGTSEAPSAPTSGEEEATPIPAPAPSPTPPGKSGGVEEGTGIDGGNGGEGGVSRNDVLGDAGGGSSTGAVPAPSANGGGDQPAQ